ncbi:hypothetical protein SAMN04488030_2103 [Aliiroseovarius halocynthiae]|nr:hypothetical protein SAMN04488030_2103 [Aliiroseovarius halocynthiae]
MLHQAVVFGILLPPLLVSVAAGWLAVWGECSKRRVRIGVWVSVLFAVIYYGALSLLAIINALDTTVSSQFVLILVIGALCVLVPVLVCQGAFWLVYRSRLKVKVG